MKVDRRRAEESLQQKGFRRDSSHDHVVFYHVYRGKETGIKTWVSHGAKYKEIGPDNLKSMMKQLKFQTVQPARDLLECPMTGDQYNDYLKTIGRLPSDDLT